MLGLTSFGIAFSYYFFIPVVYISIFIYKLIETKINKKKVFSKENIVFAIIVFVIPAICCFQFHFYERIVASKGLSGISRQLTGEGYIYSLIYSNFLPMLLFIFYYIYNEYKELKKLKWKKNISYSTILFIIFVVYGIICYILKENKFLSNYGFFKIQYAFSNIAFYLFIKGLIKTKDKGKIIKCLVIVFVSIYSIASFYTFFIPKYKFSRIAPKKESFKYSFHLIEHNNSIIKSIIDFDREEIELLKYADKNIDLEKEPVLPVMIETQIRISRALTNLSFNDEIVRSENFKDWNDNKKYKYLIYTNRSFYQYSRKEEDLSTGKIELFRNGSGVILQNPNYSE